MSVADVISLDEWRAARYLPEDPPPSAPALRLVEPDERPGDALRLNVFLARARLVLAETGQARDLRPLHAVPAS